MNTLARSLLVTSTLVGVAPAAAEVIRHGSAAIPGEYIVVMRAPSPATLDAAARTDLAMAIDRVAAAHALDVGIRYQAALSGFSARMTAEQAAALAAAPEVAFVEENTRMQVSAIQATPTWGLDRLDQTALPLDQRFVQLGDGAGATVYVIDTGLRTTHTELAGRVLPGAYTINDGREVTDCHGHGTHVAATVAGSRWGVAKRAQIVPVRVFDCTGSGDAANVIAGIDWVAANRRPLSVANLSLGGGANAAQDAAIKNLVAAGVTVVVAAGNENVNACLRSPARVPEAITVGATTPGDARASFSNWGPCVDLSAPGVAIESAGIASDAASLRLDGTSMAAPHVAGIAAAYLAANPTATPAQVAAALAAGAARDKITGLNNSPNLLAQSRVVDTVPPQLKIVSPDAGATVPARFTVVVESADANLESVAVSVRGTTIGKKTEGPFTFEVEGLPSGAHVIEVISSDLAGASTTEMVTVTIPDVAEDADPDRGDGGTIEGGCSSGRAVGLPLALVVFAVALRRRRAAIASAAAIAALAACEVGEYHESESPGGYVDSDGDGETDGLDTDGDGAADYTFGCSQCTPGSAPTCPNPLIDRDGDGVVDGLDLDCDGVIDVPFHQPPAGGGGSSQQCQTAVNDKAISCTRTDGGPARCECRIADQLVKTCTTTLASPCSFGAGSNCCGF